MSIHSQLTGSDLHESKGAATAAAGTVAVATGTGTATWQLPPNNCIVYGYINGSNDSPNYVPIPTACTLSYVGMCPVTSVNVSSTTFTNNGASIPNTASGSTVGTFYGFAPASNNVFNAQSILEISISGSVGLAYTLHFTLLQ